MAFEANGTTTFLKNESNTVGQITNADFSVCAWIYANSTGEGGTGKIVMRGVGTDAASTNKWWLGMGNTMALRMDVDWSSTRASSISSNNFIATSTWVFVCGVYTTSDATIRLYATSTSSDDTIAQVGTYATQTAGAGTVGSDASANIGVACRPDSATRTWDGRLAHVSVWTKALTIAEMYGVAYRPVLPAQTNLLFYWPLWDHVEGTDATTTNNNVAYSYSATALNLTCTNNGTWRSQPPNLNGPGGGGAIYHLKHVNRSSLQQIIQSTSYTNLEQGFGSNRDSLRLHRVVNPSKGTYNVYQSTGQIGSTDLYYYSQALEATYDQLVAYIHDGRVLGNVELETGGTPNVSLFKTTVNGVASTVIRTATDLDDASATQVGLWGADLDEGNRHLWGIQNAGTLYQWDYATLKPVRELYLPDATGIFCADWRGLAIHENRIYVGAYLPNLASVILDRATLKLIDAVPFDVQPHRLAYSGRYLIASGAGSTDGMKLVRASS